MATKSYIFMLTDKDRKRHEHTVEKGKVTRFVVQYEILMEESWRPIVRYDTFHGYAHKDLINPDGSKEKIFMGLTSLNEALALADMDINENWERYKERYLRRLKK
ncbi:MAG: hypothetical protein QME78_09325 [Thermodesulfobacteriota bacterium]|nr:hypothetical protein [Thermodesulfobacteriota bacterium]